MQALSPSPTNSAASAGTTRSGLSILVAEDHDTNRRLVTLMLNRLGHTADWVTNGQEAVEATQRRPYDVILMDCQMPGLNGCAATREIRRMEALHAPGKRRRIHIIAITGMAMDDEWENCRSAGMDGYISKPFTIEALRGQLALSRQIEPGAALPPTQEWPEGAAELLGVFLAETPGVLQEMGRLAEAGDWTALSRQAQLFAGSCDIYRLTDMREICWEISGMARRGAAREIPPMLSALREEFRKRGPGLEAVFGSMGGNR